MKALPVEFTNVNPELAAAIANGPPQYHVFTKRGVGSPKAITLLIEDFHMAFNALFNGQFGVFEVVTQHRFDQRSRMRA
ncbi:hypothetical protein D3C85_1729820 [compost metagenome]